MPSVKDTPEVPAEEEVKEDSSKKDADESTRRGSRRRVPSTKAKENREFELTQSVWSSREKYAKLLGKCEVTLGNACSSDVLTEIRTALEEDFKKIEGLYAELRDVSVAPDPNIRRAMDQMQADRDLIVAAVMIRQQPVEDDKVSKGSNRSHVSLRSSISAKKVTAAANLAARKAELEASKETAKTEEQIAELELEEKKRRAEMEVQLGKKKRELEQQRIEKLLRMEDAKLKILSEELQQEENQTKLFSRNPFSTPIDVIKRKAEVRKLEMESPESTMGNDIGKLAEALTTAVRLNSIPAPEPFVFSGDPLTWHDWETAFRVLIEDKPISEAEKLHYLKKYLAGSAREAVSGYLLLRSEHAFSKAKEVLRQRYGSPFVIAEAFRDKLEAWPKIQGRDGFGLRRFADFLNQCRAAMEEISSLDILNDNRENRKLLQKLPDWMVNRWTRVVYDTMRVKASYPSFAQFAEFVAREAEIACDPVASLGSLKGPEPDRKVSNAQKMTGRRTVARALAVNVDKDKSKSHCIRCDRDGHHLAQCFKFVKLPFKDRETYVKKKGLCFGCLNQGHLSKDCKNRCTCKHCDKRHPTSLHKEISETTPRSEYRKEEKESTEDTSAQAFCGRVTETQRCKGAVSMIVPVWVSSQRDPSNEHLVYALLDSQSDTSFIVDEIAEKLDAPYRDVTLELTTLSSQEKVCCQKYSQLQLRGLNSTECVPLGVAYSRPAIPADPSHIPTPDFARGWPHLRTVSHKIPPTQNVLIGMLIGYNCPQALAPRAVVTGSGSEPYAVETDLGWSIVGGKEDEELKETTTGWTHRILIKERVTPDELNRTLESDFRDLEVQRERMLSQDDMKFLDIAKTIHHREDGYYELPLPFRQRPCLPDNRQMALSRFNHLKRKFQTCPDYKRDYETFMGDIIIRGDAEVVPEEQLSAPAWYIPHHGVYNPQKPGKIRVVFDCAARYRGTSLNDHLLKGPDLANSLVGILCRFRQNRVAISCDIEKMFHQFRVTQEDQDFLRFFWKDSSERVVDYRMKVHIFGATSSPACANYGLKQLATDYEQESPLAAEFIRNDFYVDDGLKSVPDAKTATCLIQDTRKVCEKGNLKLHKFVTNDTSVLEEIPHTDRAKQMEKLDLTREATSPERVLGVQWCVESDKLQFRIVLKDMPLTRRGILSTVASIFDPLGLVAPFVLIGKQILQEMCQGGAKWDEPVSGELRQSWERWRSEISALAEVAIDRCYKPTGFQGTEATEMHHFSDASTKGYGQCSYLRMIDAEGRIHCCLLMSKARVAPLKIVTIPRLELQAAVLSTQVGNLLRSELEFQNLKEFYWTDSKVVLGYIANEARKFHVFVANRVQRIRASSDVEQWQYVCTEENPADLASRGTFVAELKASNWFSGPPFLWETSLPEKGTVTTELQGNDPEVRRVHVHTGNTQERKPFIERFDKFSDWSQAVTGTARILVLLDRKRRDIPNQEDTSCVQLQQRAEMVILRHLQQQHFEEDLERLMEGQKINRSSRLWRLDPFIDESGMLRMEGRLARMSTVNYGVKHPLILPRKSHVTELIIKHCHEAVAHQGRGMTVGAVRSRGYWIIGCTPAVSSYIHRCVTCRKMRGPLQSQKMADLPEERLQPSAPFTYCGMDCFGPYMTKDGRKERKRYGLLFTCLASRAVHVEMLDDMSTDGFINALRCFIALRGKVRVLRSDQGSNFMGARNELAKAYKEIDEEKIKRFLAGQDCDFVPNVPAASHMGGSWERQIRTIRRVLDGILGCAGNRLDGTSLRTFLYEAMAIVNSRPLSVENLMDPTGPEPITPNHLLTMKSEALAPPPGKFVTEDLYATKRWRRVQYLADQFWRRWRKEYIANLQTRHKWNQVQDNVEVGDIVLLKEEEVVRGQWKLAKIVETMPSADGLVRKVKLLLGDPCLDKRGHRERKPSYLERPIHKLVLIVKNSVE